MNEDIVWGDLTHYQQRAIKNAVQVFVAEQQIDILCRGCMDNDCVAKEEVLLEIEDFIWDYYFDKLMDEF